MPCTIRKLTKALISYNKSALVLLLHLLKEYKTDLESTQISTLKKEWEALCIKLRAIAYNSAENIDKFLPIK
jgi:hypothetical protein